MYKKFKLITICALAALSVWCGFLLSDRQKLNDNLIRFHIVANSDSEMDQQVKLQVRDAVLDSLRADLEAVANVEEAKKYLQENLPKIQKITDETLSRLGFEGTSSVSLCKEIFDVRHYDTFSLPSGVYESLRIVIGEGKGHNWWCVSFPALCVPATTDGFQSTAAAAGFPKQLTNALTGENGYQLRFYFLDKLGQLENIFFQE